jgi:ABC-type multidrug transport system ATPase subunit
MATPCPTGWYCASYLGISFQSAIDEAWTLQLKQRSEDGTAPPLPSSRWYEGPCFPGFFCSNASTIEPCPAGSFCIEGVNTPFPCDEPAACASGSSYAVSFVLPIIFLVVSTLLGGASALVIRRQRYAELASRKIQATGVGAVYSTKNGSLDQTSRINCGLGFEFEGLSLTINNRTILNDLSGSAPPATITALMGPSGCGKTTLMNTLRGRPPLGSTITGTIRVTSSENQKGDTNDSTRSSSALVTVPQDLLPSLLGFVPQDDVMDRSLTARELISFSARARLPRGTANQEIEVAVNTVLRDLGLEGVADVIIGGSENSASNISGGQLKRVSIGIELVAQPQALFLDEPTSGLDSTSALDLMTCLSRLCKERRVAIVCVLHQPRAEAFACVHNLILLSRGGRVAFEGAAKGCVPWLLKTLGSGIAGTDLERGILRQNPADFIIDCLSRTSGGSNENTDENIDHSSLPNCNLVEAWSLRKKSDETSGNSTTLSSSSETFIPPPPSASFLSQMYLACERAMLSRLRNARTLFFYLALHAFMAIALSPGFSPLIQSGYQFLGPVSSAFIPFVPPLVRGYASVGNVSDMALQQMCFFMTISCGCAGGILAIGAFGPVRAAVRREAEAGADLVALGLGRMAADAIIVAWCSLSFCAIWGLFGHFGRWWNWLGVIIGCSFAASGVGHVTSLVTRPTNAAVVVFGFVIFEAVFSGVEPHLAQVLPFPIVNLVWLLSYGLHVAQAVYGISTEVARSISDIDHGAKDFGFDATNNGIRNAIGALFGLGLLWRAVVLALLWYQQIQVRGVSKSSRVASPDVKAVSAPRVSPSSVPLMPRARFGFILLFAIVTAVASPADDLSTSCSLAASALLINDASPCAPTLGTLLSSKGGIANCTDDGFCLSDTYIENANAGYYIINKPILRGGLSCALCGNVQFTPSDCVTAVNRLVGATRSGGALATSCASVSDMLAITLLRDQSAAVCSRSDPRVLAPMYGAVSSKTLSQCVTCGIQKCTAGMICKQDSLPVQCPAGSYCPDGLNVIVCPPGYFCPIGSVQPVACRILAAGSCSSGGASREVVWVPLFIALLMTVGIHALTIALERQRVKLAGKELTAEHTHQETISKVNIDSRPRVGMGFTFRNLELITKGIKRLDKLNGRVHPGRVLAILGGSGAGKTTLMNCLLGKETPTSGTVSVIAEPVNSGAANANNNVTFSLDNPLHTPSTTRAPVVEVPLTKNELRRMLGFVPQTDILIRELSIRESVVHSAMTRLPSTISMAEAEAHAQETLDGLGLAHVATSLVGDASGAARGVSGGERKRLSIALELVADPLVLFLDEPTTGLDSAAALTVMSMLRRLARQRGITCVAVVHQPRQEIVDVIDDLVLLGRGGRPIFLGPRALALRYLCDALGYELPEQCSPADFLLDVANGKHGMPKCTESFNAFIQRNENEKECEGKEIETTEDATEDNAKSVIEIVVALASAWNRGGAAWVQKYESAIITPSPSLIDATSSISSSLSTKWSTQIREQLKPRRNALQQVVLHALRGVRQRLRGSSLLLDLTSMLLGGFILGIVLSGGQLYLPVPPLQYFGSCPSGSTGYCTLPLRIMYQPATFYYTMIVGALAVAPAVRLFGAEREVGWREAGVGVPAASYFVGKLLAELPVWALMALNITAPLVAVAPLRGPVGGFFALAMACIAVCSSMAVALSATFGADCDKANLAGVILATVLNLAGGFVPLLGKNGAWAYTHWTARAFVAIEIGDGYNITGEMFDYVARTEWAKQNWQRDLGVLCLIATIAFAFALALTITLYRDKRR